MGAMGEKAKLVPSGRLVGNAGPTPLSRATGMTFTQHASQLEKTND